jgi:hypothetical protein
MTKNGIESAAAGLALARHCQIPTIAKREYPHREMLRIFCFLSLVSGVSLALTLQLVSWNKGGECQRRGALGST